nr:hypothetical protein [Prauserella flava]
MRRADEVRHQCADVEFGAGRRTGELLGIGVGHQGGDPGAGVGVVLQALPQIRRVGMQLSGG